MPRTRTDGADVVIVGAGMAGAAAAFELCRERAVIVVEQERHPGYHATGRSAAFFRRSYAHSVTRTLARASHPFLSDPPGDFADSPLLARRAALFFARPDQWSGAKRRISEFSDAVSNVEVLDEAAVRSLIPIFRPGHLAGALYEQDGGDIDVGALLHGYLRGLKRRRGRILCNTQVHGIRRGRSSWLVTTSSGMLEARIVVNAAGPWADAVARVAGIVAVRLVPLRRTAALIAAPASISAREWPVAIDIEERFYFKPESGALLISPADETPAVPSDAQAEEFDVALGIDRFEQATDIHVRHVKRTWAGLRTFAPDRVPVVGFDPDAEGFFWLAGQGGTGIATASALGRCCASLIERHSLPDDIIALGLDETRMSPARLRRATARHGSVETQRD